MFIVLTFTFEIKVCYIPSVLFFALCLDTKHVDKKRAIHKNMSFFSLGKLT